jgi:hypothetical protein
VPHGRRETMNGHPHDVEPEVLGPIVEAFLDEGAWPDAQGGTRQVPLLRQDPVTS